jgi:F-type H+-transporting ATPase subunit b
LRDFLPHGRLSSPVVRFAFLALLTAGLAFPAIRAGAQQSAPAASATASPAAARSADTSQARPKTEEEEINGFLHAPVVRSIGKMMHLDVVTTARIFEGINFVIIFLLIAIPLGKLLPKAIRKRSQTLRDGIKNAREATEDAKTRLSAVEAKLAGLDEEIQKIGAQVELESLEDQARIKAAIKEESARIVASAEQELSVAAAQARRELRRFAADLAIQHAEKQLALTPETDRALIAEFIGQVAGDRSASDGANHGGAKNRGGQN